MSDAANGHPRDRLSEYLDDELDVSERASVDRHLAACEDCRGELEALRRLSRAIADESVPPVPAELAAQIRRRLDAVTIVRPRRFRFVVPTTIAATLAAIGILVALQWREGRLGTPIPPEPELNSHVQDEAGPASAPAPPVTPREEVAPRKEKQDEAKRRDALEKDLARSVEQNPEGVAAGVVGETAGAAERPVPADDRRRERAISKAANEPTGFVQPAPAAKLEARSPCGDRWSDSGVLGTWEVADVRAAAGELDRIAHDVGGAGVWRGSPDGRPYVLVVPRGRFEEVFFALRARGVAGLVEPPALVEGSDCASLSIALEYAEGSAAPPR